MSNFAYYFRRLRAKLTSQMSSIETQTLTYKLLGQTLKIQDFKSSHATDTIYKELKQDCYGLSQIRFTAGEKVIDIGGHVGFFSILLAKLQPGITIFAFEPVLENFLHFQQNIELNQVENIILENQAVSADGRELEIYMHPLNTGGGMSPSLVQEQDLSQHSHYKVSSVNLDSIFDKHHIQRCRLLKIDCEGSEYEVLLNSTLLNQVDYLAGEFHINQKLRSEGHSIEGLVSHCQNSFRLNIYFIQPVIWRNNSALDLTSQGKSFGL